MRTPSRHKPKRTIRVKRRSTRASIAAPPGTTRAVRRSRRNRSAVGGNVFPTRSRSTPVVRRVVLGVLLVAAFGLVTVSYRSNTTGVHNAQLHVLDVFAPIERGMNRAWDPVAGAWDWSGRLFTAMGDAPKLKQQNSELRTSLRVAQAQVDENKELRRILDVSEQGVYPAGYRQVVGSVISRGSSPVDRDIVLNIGSDKGVRTGQAVMTAEGLIGIVTGVSLKTAEIGLILDSANQPTAKIVGTDGDGGTGILETVTSEGQPAMRIEKVRQSEQVDEGDVVYTAGFTSSNGLKDRYPKDIPIGIVHSAINGAANEYKTIQVDPFADFDDLRDVFVLVPTTDESGLDVMPKKPALRADLGLTVPSATQQPITTAQAKAAARAAAAKRAAAKRDKDGSKQANTAGASQ